MTRRSFPPWRALLESTPASPTCWTESRSRHDISTTTAAATFSVLAKPNAWFTYYYWLDDARMPDFARTVDIHRKPGYDPAELFIDPAITWPKLKIAARFAEEEARISLPHGRDSDRRLARARITRNCRPAVRPMRDRC